MDTSNPQLKILLCGKSGAGKSSLINSLFGENTCKVGEPGLIRSSQALARCTITTEKHVKHLDGVDVCIFDSPGLQDGTNDEESYVEDMHSKCKDVNLVLYCMEMTACRFESAEISAIGMISKKFGSTIWERCTLVLTKANNVYIPLDARSNKFEYHKTLLQNHRDRFCSQLEETGVSKEACDGLQAVAAGHFDYRCNGDDPERYIHFASMHNADQESSAPFDFVTELWVTCLEAVKPCKSRMDFLQATALHGRVQEGGRVPTGNLQKLLLSAAKNLLEQTHGHPRAPLPKLNLGSGQSRRVSKSFSEWFQDYCNIL